MLTRSLYTFLLWLLLPVVPLRLLWRGLRQPEYLQHVGERFGFFNITCTKPVIWLHCVSVGETRAALPLVSLLKQRYPQHHILLTHGTPTGRATSEQLFGDEVLRCYLPYDLPFAVKRFLRHYQPQLGLLMETELWFNLIHLCQQRALPLYLVNARLSEKSARGYAMLGKLAHNGLQRLTAIAAQTEQDASRFAALGAQQVEVTGNIKFDVTPSAQAIASGMALRQQWHADRPVFLAASTREGEEELVLDAVAQLNIPNLLTVIVPRHPQRFDAVAGLLEKRSVSYLRRSQLTAPFPVKGGGVSVILGDSMGEMETYYAACDVALIGGSLLPFGGQNLIEACALGKPVLVGMHTYNFSDAVAQAVENGAAIRIKDEEELSSRLQQLLTDGSKQDDNSSSSSILIAAPFSTACAAASEKL